LSAIPFCLALIGHVFAVPTSLTFAVEGWERLCSQAPGPVLTAWTALRADPRGWSQRQHPLKADFAARSVGGRVLEQWQYEVTGAGRIWYAIGDERRVETGILQNPLSESLGWRLRT
jgi:hypothetical protein